MEVLSFRGGEELFSKLCRNGQALARLERQVEEERTIADDDLVHNKLDADLLLSADCRSPPFNMQNTDD